MQPFLRAGDTLDFTTTLVDYPASDGWTLVHRLIPRTSGTAISITSSASGDDHRTTATATTTASWAVGEYTWFAYATKGAESYTVDDGVITIAANPRTATTYDGRSQAEVALDAVDAVIANRATLDQRSYSIAGRSLERMPIGELLALRSALRIDVLNERRVKRVAQGLDDQRRIYLRAGNA